MFDAALYDTTMLMNHGGRSVSTSLKPAPVDGDMSITMFRNETTSTSQRSVAFDGQYLWYLVGGQSVLIKTNLFDPRDVSTVNLRQASSGYLVDDGKYIWVLSSTLLRVHQKTHQVAGFVASNNYNGNSNVANGLRVTGAVLLNNRIICANTNQIAVIDTATGTITGYSVDGLTATGAAVYDGRYVWISAPSKKALLRVDPETMEHEYHEVSAELKSIYSGLGWDGMHLWFAAEHTDTVNVKNCMVGYNQYAEEQEQFRIFTTMDDRNDNLSTFNIAAASFSYDGKYIWTKGESGPIKLDPATGTMRGYKGEAGAAHAVHDIAFDGNALYLAGTLGIMKLATKTGALRNPVMVEYRNEDGVEIARNNPLWLGEGDDPVTVIRPQIANYGYLNVYVDGDSRNQTYVELKNVAERTVITFTYRWTGEGPEPDYNDPDTYPTEIIRPDPVPAGKLYNHGGYNYSVPVEAAQLDGRMESNLLEQVALQGSTNSPITYVNRSIYDGRYLWVYTEGYLASITKIDPYTDEKTTMALPAATSGPLVYDGNNIWVLNSAVMIRMDSQTGKTSLFKAQNDYNRNSNLKDTNVVSAVAVGNHIICVCKTQIIVINSTTGTMTGHDIEGLKNPGAAVYDGMDLWINLNADKALLRVNPLNFTDYEYCALPDDVTTVYAGLTWDQRRLWLAGEISGTSYTNHMISFDPVTKAVERTWSTQENSNNNGSMCLLKPESMIYDGKYIWIWGVTWLVRVNPENGEMRGYPSVLARAIATAQAFYTINDICSDGNYLYWCAYYRYKPNNYYATYRRLYKVSLAGGEEKFPIHIECRDYKNYNSIKKAFTSTWIKENGPWTETAPSVEGYTCVAHTINGGETLLGDTAVIDKVTETTTIVFLYDEGNPDEYAGIALYYLDETDASIVGYRNVAYPVGDIYSTSAPTFTGYEYLGYRLDDGDLIANRNVTFTVEQNQHKIAFVYRQIPVPEIELFPVVVQCRNEKNQIIGTYESRYLEKGESFRATRPSLEGYIYDCYQINDANKVYGDVTEIVIDEVLKPYVITFFFESPPDLHATHPIILEYMDQGGELLENRVSVHIVEGRGYEIAAKSFRNYRYVGYRLDGGSVQYSSTVRLENITESHTISFVYSRLEDAEDPVLITVKYQNRETGNLIQNSSVIQAERGLTFTDYPPYIENYDYWGCQLDGEAETENISSIQLDDVQQPHTIIWLYTPIGAPTTWAGYR